MTGLTIVAHLTRGRISFCSMFCKGTRLSRSAIQRLDELIVHRLHMGKKKSFSIFFVYFFFFFGVLLFQRNGCCTLVEAFVPR